MKDFKTIILMDVVTGTVTNAEGLTLFGAMNHELCMGRGVRLSLENATTFSSSFLNSSFGELIDKYGLASIKTNVIITNYQPSRLKQLKDYIEKVKSLV